MGLTITRAQGQLNLTVPTEDAVICLVMSGVAVSGKLVLGTCYQIFGTDALVALGITSSGNPVAYKDITDFYAAAGEGAELNIMLLVNTTTFQNICDTTQQFGKKLIESTDGRAVVFLANMKRASGYTPTITNGLDNDVNLGIVKLQIMAAEYDDLNIPFVGILPAHGFDKTTISTMLNRVALSDDYTALNAYCTANDGVVSMGLLAGWIAKHQVHENVGRVASGKVSDTAFFPDGTPAKDLRNAFVQLNDKGMLFPVKVGNKSGYYYQDDPCHTTIASDYSSLSWNRTINKAKRIAAGILLEKLNDEVDLNPKTGKIESSVASDWESDVENAIKAQMMRATATKKKEISGVKCTVDPDSDILNNEVSASINIVRKGQAKNIVVRIGYVPTI